MNHKEWIFKIISHQEMDRVPYHFDFTPPARKKLVDYFNTTEIENFIGLPIRWNATNSIKPLYADPKIYGEQLGDEFGVNWFLSEHNRGMVLKPVLSEPNLSNYIFPNPVEEYRYKDLKNWCCQNNKHFKVIWIGDLWERATFMRGTENILIDLILNKSFVFELLDKISEYILKTMEIILGRFEFDAFSLSDDYGTQKAMLMSPKIWRQVIKPFLKEIISMAKKNNKIMMLHSCGNIYEIIGDLVDMGVDILHPIQPEAMNVFDIKKEFGKYITLQGGLRTQDLLSNGTPNDIKNEIKMLKDRLGKGGGYILEPGITVQGDIPLENLIAMIEAAKESS